MITMKGRLTGAMLLLGIVLLVLLTGCGNISPVASFTCSPSSGQSPLTVSFDASASHDPDGNITAYEWNFGDGGHKTGITTTHTYTTAGTRSATLTVTDSDGARGTSSHTIVITSPPHEPLEVLDWQLVPYDNIFMPWVVTGHAKNISGHTLNYAEVDAQFYDAGNILLTSWLDNMTNLPAGVTWEFNIYCTDSTVAGRVDHATVAVGTCY